MKILIGQWKKSYNSSCSIKVCHILVSDWSYTKLTDFNDSKIIWIKIQGHQLRNIKYYSL